ncbi:MAG: S8 family serine peptidase [Candidatus Thermoplasmatota archaeon]|nr:S8 family serine peptidase [Candidatus Thermoplasmatota archaeon]
MKNRVLCVILALAITISVFSGCLSTENQWALSNTQLDVLMSKYDGSGITIGIVDTGVDISHPALSAMSIIAWKDYVNGKSSPYDDNGHGTHVCGILAATSNWYDFFFGRPEINGIAPKASYIIAKAIDSGGSGTDQNVAAAINFCASNGADVICLSLGGKDNIPILGTNTGNAASSAASNGIFVVAAAGNDEAASDVAIPADQQNVIAVGAVDSNNVIASFSQRGSNGGILPGVGGRSDPNKKPEVVAPGVGIISCWKEGLYGKASGTSQAVPYAGGAIALVLQAHGPVSISAMKTALMNTAKKCPGQATPHDNRYGYGLIQAADLLAALQ